MELWAVHGSRCSRGATKPYYQLSALESWTWGSQPLTVLYVPGSPLRHGPLSVGSDSKAKDHSLTPTPGFGSSLIRQPTRACSPAMWSVLLWLYRKSVRQQLKQPFHHTVQLRIVLLNFVFLCFYLCRYHFVNTGRILLIQIALTLSLNKGWCFSRPNFNLHCTFAAWPLIFFLCSSNI